MSANDERQKLNEGALNLQAPLISQLLASFAKNDGPRAQAILKIADQLAHKLDLDEGVLEDLIQDL